MKIQYYNYNKYKNPFNNNINSIREKIIADQKHKDNLDSINRRSVYKTYSISKLAFHSKDINIKQNTLITDYSSKIYPSKYTTKLPSNPKKANTKTNSLNSLTTYKSNMLTDNSNNNNRNFIFQNNYNSNLSIYKFPNKTNQNYNIFKKSIKEKSKPKYLNANFNTNISNRSLRSNSSSESSRLARKQLKRDNNRLYTSIQNIKPTLSTQTKYIQLIKLRKVIPLEEFNKRFYKEKYKMLYLPKI